MPIPPPEPPSSAQPGAGLHVLVLEDAPVNQKLAVMALQRFGARVSVQGDGVPGLAAVRSGAFDLVLMDLHLPGLDGWDVLAALQADPGVRRVPVVVLTGDGRPGLDDRARRAGAVGFLLKPARLDDFRRLLERHAGGDAGVP